MPQYAEAGVAIDTGKGDLSYFKMVISKDLFFKEVHGFGGAEDANDATTTVHVDLRIHNISEIDLKAATFLADARLEVYWTDDAAAIRDREVAYREASEHCEKNAHCTLTKDRDTQVIPAGDTTEI